MNFRRAHCNNNSKDLWNCLKWSLEEFIPIQSCHSIMFYGVALPFCVNLESVPLQKDCHNKCTSDKACRTVPVKENLRRVGGGVSLKLPQRCIKERMASVWCKKNNVGVNFCQAASIEIFPEHRARRRGKNKRTNKKATARCCMGPLGGGGRKKFLHQFFFITFFLPLLFFLNERSYPIVSFLWEGEGSIFQNWAWQTGGTYATYSRRIWAYARQASSMLNNRFLFANWPVRIFFKKKLG